MNDDDPIHWDHGQLVRELEQARVEIARLTSERNSDEQYIRLLEKQRDAAVDALAGVDRELDVNPAEPRMARLDILTRDLAQANAGLARAHSTLTIMRTFCIDLGGVPFAIEEIDAILSDPLSTAAYEEQQRAVREARAEGMEWFALKRLDVSAIELERRIKNGETTMPGVDAVRVLDARFYRDEALAEAAKLRNEAARARKEDQ